MRLVHHLNISYSVVLLVVEGVGFGGGLVERRLPLSFEVQDTRQKYLGIHDID